MKEGNLTGSVGGLLGRGQCGSPVLVSAEGFRGQYSTFHRPPCTVSSPCGCLEGLCLDFIVSLGGGKRSQTCTSNVQSLPPWTILLANPNDKRSCSALIAHVSGPFGTAPFRDRWNAGGRAQLAKTTVNSPPQPAMQWDLPTSLALLLRTADNGLGDYFNISIQIPSRSDSPTLNISQITQSVSVSTCLFPKNKFHPCVAFHHLNPIQSIWMAKVGLMCCLPVVQTLCTGGKLLLELFELIWVLRKGETRNQLTLPNSLDLNLFLPSLWKART